MVDVDNSKSASNIPCYLSNAFITTLLYETDFLESMFPTDTKITLMCPKRNIQTGGSSRLRIIHPMRKGTLHCKLWLLTFDTFLRVVISSANVKPMDWEGMTENFWFQDFPRLDQTKTAPEYGSKAKDFVDQLSYFISILIEEQDVSDIPDLSCYDMSRASVSLVASIPGKWSGSQLENLGCFRIRKVLQNIKFPEEFESSKTPLCIQTSNIGRVYGKGRSKFLPCLSSTLCCGNENIDTQIIFPCVNSMEKSSFCKEHGWYFYCNEVSRDFREHCYDLVDTTWSSLLYHSKLYWRISDGVGWLYAGSHNLSGSAWGFIKSTDTTQTVRINNFELGVLLINCSRDSLMLKKHLFNMSFDKFKPESVPWSPNHDKKDQSSLK